MGCWRIQIAWNIYKYEYPYEIFTHIKLGGCEESGWMMHCRNRGETRDEKWTNI